jgi:hypothetical protein
VAQSVRSVTPELLAKLWVKNGEYEVQDLQRIRKLGATENSEWGGARLRMMLQSIYIIAFLCLLRFDEVLRIEMKDIEVMDKFKGHIKLTLPFRKTHQYGGTGYPNIAIAESLEIKPFHLYWNRKERYLDPTDALLRWIGELRQTTGPLFRKFDVYDRPMLVGSNVALVLLRSA